MRKIEISLAMAALILLTGCARKQPDLTTLKIAVNDIYCTETACLCVHDVAARNYTNTLKKLSTTGIQLEFTYFMEPYQLEEAVLSDQYDGVLSKPWLALRLQEQHNANYERVVDVLDPNENRWLSGIIIVPAHSPILSLDELNGKNIVIGEADSYEKYQAALRLFEDRNIKPAHIELRASCGENIGELLDEKVDAAVISDYALSAGCAVDFAKPSDFRILAQTEKIPLTSLLVDRNKVDAELILQLRQHLLSVSGDAADESLLSTGFIQPATWHPPELEDES